MICVNGTPTEGRDGATVAELLEALGIDAGARGVAVAIDGEIVPRGEWPARAVPAGARVEALTAMQGG
jgi:sulfur carrier protein